MNFLKNPEEVTVLVFKDNATARTFQVPLGWIHRLGLAAGALVGATLVSSIFALRFYKVASNADTSHLRELETQLTQLKVDKQALEAKVAHLPASAPAPSSTLAAFPPHAPTAPSAPVATGQSIASVASVPSGDPGSILWAFPAQTRDLSAQAASLPITVSTPQIRWNGNLRVDFNLQYTATDGGNQQGHIIVLARGPGTLLSYPEEALSRGGSASLLAPDRGEYFSVSRFREVKAAFNQIRSARQVSEVEVLLLSLEGHVIYRQKVPVPQKAAAPARGAAVPKPQSSVAAPAAPRTETIEPGTDQ